MGVRLPPSAPKIRHLAGVMCDDDLAGRRGRRLLLVRGIADGLVWVTTAWQPTARPMVRQQREKRVVRVDGIDTETGHAPSTTAWHLRRSAQRAASKFTESGHIGRRSWDRGALVESELAEATAAAVAELRARGTRLDAGRGDDDRGLPSARAAARAFRRCGTTALGSPLSPRPSPCWRRAHRVDREPPGVARRRVRLVTPSERPWCVGTADMNDSGFVARYQSSPRRHECCGANPRRRLALSLRRTSRDGPCRVDGRPRRRNARTRLHWESPPTCRRSRR